MKLRFWKGGASDANASKAPEFGPTALGWAVVDPGDEDHPGNAYLNQLLDELYAQELSAGLMIPWVKLFELLGNPDHLSSLHLLALPKTADLLPSICSHGTPTDPTFRVTLDGWITESNLAVDATRVGATLTVSGETYLLRQPAHTLVESLEELALHGADWSTEQRMLQMGTIQRNARWAQASVDRYLQQSPVVLAEKVRLDLNRHEDGSLSPIELVPSIEGASEGWISQFDRYGNVRGRYDVSDKQGGMRHVVLSHEVREVAEAIKGLPGRRLSERQADVLLRDPTQVLGDAAAGVISQEQLTAAGAAANLYEWELDVLPGGVDAAWEAVLIDPLGAQDSVFLAELDGESVASLLGAADDAAAIGVIRWRGYRISLTGLTLESLARLHRAKVAVTLEAALGKDALFDLAYYSDRVVGFDGKAMLIPRVPVSTPGKKWIEEGVSYTRVDPDTGRSSEGRLSPEDVAELGQRVKQAETGGKGTVEVPGTDTEVSTEEAKAWITAIQSMGKAAADRTLDTPKNPAPAERLSLRILHNIEDLEYASQDVAQSQVQESYQAPAALRPEIQLKEHQVQGVAWMQRRVRQRAEGVRGVLLADDMGLGKTLQALTLMAWYRQSDPSPKPCLIVAPVSLLENWKSEIAKFLDGRQGETVTLYGEHLAAHRLTARELGPELRELGLKKALNPGFAHGAAFVLTTYETLRDYQLSMAREKWGVLVCDEAQKIKTPAAMVTRAAKAMQADFKIACTGTPVENSLSDLWCLCDFFQPGLLDSLGKFTKVFRQDIELRAEGHETKVEVLRNQISPWVLRRMKSEVADLKPKREFVCELPMSGRQRSMYSEAAQQFRRAVDEEKGGGTAALKLLHRLRLICANPLSASDEGAEFLSLDEHLSHSPKLTWLLEKLAAIKVQGEKAIVFTEFRDIQRLIQRAVSSRLGYQASVVNGSTNVDAQADDSRQAIIDAFQAKSGFGVIVLSTTAVGFGVNIQAANHVIHFTRPWNPAKEDQATDRAYRIGQEKEVFVYYPTVKGDGFESFEERVAQRLAAKRMLSNDMLAPEQGLSLQEFTDLSG